MTSDSSSNERQPVGESLHELVATSNVDGKASDGQYEPVLEIPENSILH
jgi:hypothetical protein